MEQGTTGSPASLAPSTSRGLDRLFQRPRSSWSRRWSRLGTGGAGASPTVHTPRHPYPLSLRGHLPVGKGRSDRLPSPATQEWSTTEELEEGRSWTGSWGLSMVSTSISVFAKQAT